MAGLNKNSLVLQPHVGGVRTDPSVENLIPEKATRVSTIEFNDFPNLLRPKKIKVFELGFLSDRK